jgi:hypothetical protein
MSDTPSQTQPSQDGASKMPVNAPQQPFSQSGEVKSFSQNATGNYSAETEKGTYPNLNPSTICAHIDKK